MSPRLKATRDKNREFVGVRVTAEEKRKIDALAEAAGQSTSDWLRDAVRAHVARSERGRRDRGTK